MPDVASLEPEIHAILTAPAVDLNTVSAKRVRAQIRQNNPELGDAWVREHKDEIDKLTAAVFEKVRAGDDNQPAPSPPTSADPAASPPPVAVVTKGVGKRKRSVEEEADAEYARQLASELNAHKTRGGSAGAVTKKTTGRRKAKKSAEEIIESDEDAADEGKAPAKKPKKKRKSVKTEDGEEPKKRGGFQKEYTLSPAMADFTGVQALSRPQIVKKLWDHIKANSLQNPQDKREILCDEAMQQVFGVNRLNMFKMSKLVSDHVFEKQD